MKYAYVIGLLSLLAAADSLAEITPAIGNTCAYATPGQAFRPDLVADLNSEGENVVPAAPHRCPYAIPNGTPLKPPYGLKQRVSSKPYLQMPASADGDIPRLLSKTGAFADTPALKPNPDLIPYELVVPFWSDGAAKTRFIALPPGKIEFSPVGGWKFPAGTVFIKTFEMPVDANNPSLRRRLETRLLVRDRNGGVYGADYKWRADGSDADLLSGGETESISTKAADGELHEQVWYYPSREDCLTCHTARAGGVLGLSTRQLNRSSRYPSGVTDNELRAWNHIGLFAPAIAEQDLPALPALAAADDASRSLADRARSYLDANCSQCHRPGGTVANFDARYDTALDAQGLINGPVLIDQGIDRPRVISPHDLWRSILYMRADTNGDIRMPPLARQTIDQRGVQLLGEWILSMPGKDVLEPPRISPAGGTFGAAVEVTISDADADAEIRYTLDGSAPTPADLRYEKPIELRDAAVVRARAYKQGSTRSITAQQVFVVAP